MPLLKLVLVAILVVLTACSSTDDQPVLETSEKQLYDAIQRQLKSRNWQIAVRNLQLLESRYPFGNYAEQAQLELIYAHFQASDHPEAVAAAERFIRLHPRHPNVDYAYYLKGLSAFSEGRGLFERFMPTDLSSRDPGPARQSFADFSELVARYPNSDYAADARARMIHLRNLLARYEINVANYYFKRKAYVAAAKRGQYVVENFPQTPAVPDGLAVMIQAYILLGLDQLADNSLAVLKENYPEHPSIGSDGSFITIFTHDGPERSWINKISFGLFDAPSPPKFDTREIYGS